MNNKYDLMWAQIVQLIQAGDGVNARKIWDEVVEDAWKYQDLCK